jgi:hypothetical protein
LQADSPRYICVLAIELAVVLFEISSFTDPCRRFTENRTTDGVQPSIVTLSQLKEDLDMHTHSDHSHLMRCHRGNPRRHLLWGVALVALGTIFLMDRLAWLDLTQYLGPQTRWWHFLPLLLALGGAIRLLSAHTARQVVKGLGRMAVGVWLFASLEQLWGLTFANSWPVLLVAAGAQMLVCGWYGWGGKHCGEVTS